MGYRADYALVRMPVGHPLDYSLGINVLGDLQLHIGGLIFLCRVPEISPMIWIMKT